MSSRAVERFPRPRPVAILGIVEVHVSPLLVLPRGQGAGALDALIATADRMRGTFEGTK